MQKVIRHLMGFLKNHLSGEDKACRGRLELLGLIEETRQGPPNSSRTSFWGSRRSRCHLWWGGFCQGARVRRAALNRYPVPERVHQQVYLHPHPKELMPRNHL